MSEIGPKRILGFFIFLIVSALVFFYRGFIIDLVQQSFFFIIVIMLGFLYVATRSITRTPDPVYTTRDQFSVTINTPNISKPVLKDELHKWIKKRKIWVTINITDENWDHIQIKSPVQLISYGSGTRWTPYPMMIYYITFIFRDNQIEIDAEVEYPKYDQLFSSQVKISSRLGVLKCRDFIFLFFKQLGISEDALYRKLYSKSGLEGYLQETDNAVLRFFYIIFGILFVIFSLFFVISGNIFDASYGLVSCGLFIGICLFGATRLQSKKYRQIMNHYFKNEDSSTFK